MHYCEDTCKNNSCEHKTCKRLAKLQEFLEEAIPENDYVVIVIEPERPTGDEVKNSALLKGPSQRILGALDCLTDQVKHIIAKHRIFDDISSSIDGFKKGSPYRN